MSEHAEQRSPAAAAAEAVKAYIRMNRARLARDGELLALLLPDRFSGANVGDLQRHVIDRLASENAALRHERDGVRGAREQAARLGEGVRRAVLDLIDARSFAETIEIAQSSARTFGGDHAALCVESDDGNGHAGCTGVRLITRGTSAAMLGRDGMGAILSRGGEILLGPVGAGCRSLAAFRLRIGGPEALYVLGAREEHRFEGEEATADLSFFARALERSIRTWLDLPKL